MFTYSSYCCILFFRFSPFSPVFPRFLPFFSFKTKWPTHDSCNPHFRDPFSYLETRGFLESTKPVNCRGEKGGRQQHPQYREKMLFKICTFPTHRARSPFFFCVKSKGSPSPLPRISVRLSTVTCPFSNRQQETL